MKLRERYRKRGRAAGARMDRRLRRMKAENNTVILNTSQAIAPYRAVSGPRYGPDSAQAGRAGANAELSQPSQRVAARRAARRNARHRPSCPCTSDSPRGSQIASRGFEPIRGRAERQPPDAGRRP